MAAAARTLRSPLAVTLTVWKALFLRETVARLAQDRIAWIGLVVEPAAHVAFLMWLFSAGLRTRVIAGADTGVFIMLGITGFFLVRNVMIRCMDAVDASENLYAFRQIKPVDTVIMRAVSEGVLMCLVLIVLFAGAGLIGHPVVPADPLGAMAALGALWLLGLGLGLTFSVFGSLVPEFGRLVRLLITLFYFFSAVIFPTMLAPVAVRDVLLLNPVLHGIESLRIAFMPTYQVPSGISILFVVGCAVPLVLLGLALHVRYRTHLMTQ